MGHNCSAQGSHDSDSEVDSASDTESEADSDQKDRPVGLWQSVANFFGFGRRNALNLKVQLPYNEGERIEKYIELERKEPLGTGGYGIVCLGKDIRTNVKYAVKQIAKAKLPDTSKAKLEQEVRIMCKLDHPNVIKLFQTFQDPRYVYLVLEMCQGGELFDQIIKEKHFAEDVAADVMQQVFRAIHYTHEMDIVHRDLKPENLMLMTAGPLKGNTVKVIDYGIAAEWKGQLLQSKNGTPDYVAPELVLLLESKGSGYGKELDVWSSGVILYILLSGRLPFKGSNDNETFKKIKAGKMKWEGFQNVSGDAKYLVSRLLTVDKHKRATMGEALQHTWIVHKAPGASLVGCAEAIGNLTKFSRQNKLKRAALHLVARQIDDRKLDQLRAIFTKFDTNGDGLLTIKELNAGLAQSGMTDAKELHDLAKALDSDHSGSVDYTEFLAATLDQRAALDEAACWAAFRVFDKNNDGVISVKEFQEVMQNRDVQHSVGKHAIQTMMAEVDLDNNGVIDFQEFMEMLRK